MSQTSDKSSTRNGSLSAATDGRPGRNGNGAGQSDNGKPGSATRATFLTGGNLCTYDGEGVYRADGSQSLDYCPQVVEAGVIPADSGEPQRRYYIIKVDGDEVEVTHPALRAGECWDQLPGAVGVGTRRMRDMLADLVQAQARGLDRTTALERPGWHTIKGRRHYVFEDGRTVPDAPVPVRVINMPAAGIEAVAPVDEAGPADIRGALETMAGHGWGPLFSVGVGLRTLAQSLLPVPAGLAMVGDPGSGKDCCAFFALAVRCDPGWAPYAISTFGATTADLEVKVDRSRDQVGLITDLPLTLKSSPREQQDGRAKLEAVFRPMFNGTAIRPRRRRDMTAQRDNRVHCYPFITAQLLPVDLQESLYRRFIAVQLHYGDADVAWYGERKGVTNARPLLVPLRSAGEHFLRMLADADDPAAILSGNDAKALDVLAPYVSRSVPGWDVRTDCFREVVYAAAAIGGGLAWAADAAGMPDRWELFRAIAPDLCEALAGQAGMMDDQRTTTDDFPTAVSEVIRTALRNGKAHIRNHPDDRECPAVPGLTPQEQGLSDANPMSGKTYNGRGVPMYYLPEVGPGLGIENRNLRDMLDESADRRVHAYPLTVKKLPEALDRHSMIVPSERKGKATTHEVWFGHGREDRYRKYPLVLRVEAVWPDLGKETHLVQNMGDTGDTGDTAGQGDNPNIGPDSRKNAVTTGVARVARVAQETDKVCVCPRCGHESDPVGNDGSCYTCSTGLDTIDPGGPIGAPSAEPGEAVEPGPAPPAASPARPMQRRHEASARAQRVRPPEKTLAERREIYAADIREGDKVAGGDWAGADDDDLWQSLDLAETALKGFRITAPLRFEGINLYKYLRAHTGAPPVDPVGAASFMRELNTMKDGRSGVCRNFSILDPGALDGQGDGVTGADVNGQYLNALSVLLPEGGEPEPVRGPVTVEDLKMTATGSQWRPGFARCADADMSALPGPFAMVGPGQWMTTALLRLLYEWSAEGMCKMPVITDAWLWPRDPEVSKNWCDPVRKWLVNARLSLIGRSDVPARIALAYIKAIPNVFVSMLASDPDNDGYNREMLRLEWRDMIAYGHALYSMWRGLITVRPRPFAVAYNDSAYFAVVSPGDKPAATGRFQFSEADGCDGKGVARPYQVGKWKVHRACPMTPEIRAAVEGGRASAAGVSNMVKAAHEAYRAGGDR